MKIVFFESIEHPGFYLIYKAKQGFTKIEEMHRRLTNTGEFENSGYPKIEIKPGFIIELDAPESFFSFLADHVSTNHVSHPKYDVESYRAWYEFIDLSNTDKWLTKYYSWQRENIRSTSAIQTRLF